jgi:hypothetical protein
VYRVESTQNAGTRETLWEVIKVAIADGYFKDPIRDQVVIHTP